MTTPATPRAFLSHSNVDKEYVRQVFTDLGPTLSELDEITFEPAKFNKDVISNALSRSGAFVLFASKSSIHSDWVAHEIAEALERFDKKQLARIVVYCLDTVAYSHLDPKLKRFNIVRVLKSPRVCARQIRGILADIFSDRATSDVFIARDENLGEMKRLLVNPTKDFRAFSVSGFERLGRRQLVRRLCRDIYGSFNPPSDAIQVGSYTSADDIFRELIRLQFHDLTQSEIVARFTAFSAKSGSEQVALIGSEIRRIYEQREFVMFLDLGGIVGEDGDFTELFQLIMGANADLSDLHIIFILFRNIPARIQHKYFNVAFYRLDPLSDPQSELYINHLLKRRRTNLTQEQIGKLVDLCDGLPANIDYVIQFICPHNGVDPASLEELLARPSEFQNWKRGRASAYVARFDFSNAEKLIIGLLAQYRSLTTELLSRLADLGLMKLEQLSGSLRRLLDLNLVDSIGGQYTLIRPLRDALERDERFDVPANQTERFAKCILETLNDYGDEDTVPIALVDASIIAAVNSGRIATGWISRIVLPSHYIWLAREHYHQRDYAESLRLASKALDAGSIMKDEARHEALRFLGLSAARLARSKEFELALAEIVKLKVRRARGSYFFLRGFKARLEGKLEDAFADLSKAEKLMTGNIEVQRELINVLLARREYESALGIARRLVERAQHNPFVLDAYVQARIGLAPKVEELDYDADFQHHLEKLREVGDGPDLSFYALRVVDMSLRKGEFEKALEFANRAVDNTRTLPAAFAARARVHSAQNNFEKALDDLRDAEKLGRGRSGPKNRLDLYRMYEVRFEVNLQKGRFDFCRQDIENIAPFYGDRAKELKRELAHRITKTRTKVDAEFAAWLKS